MALRLGSGDCRPSASHRHDRVPMQRNKSMRRTDELHAWSRRRRAGSSSSSGSAARAIVSSIAACNARNQQLARLVCPRRTAPPACRRSRASVVLTIELPRRARRASSAAPRSACLGVEPDGDRQQLLAERLVGRLRRPRASMYTASRRGDAEHGHHAACATRIRVRADPVAMPLRERCAELFQRFRRQLLGVKLDEQRRQVTPAPRQRTLICSIGKAERSRES